MKKIKLLSVIALVACNIVILSSKANANVANPGITAGIAGSINHVPTCHCPDDAKSCYCDVK